jgi:hypothetical protein
MMVRISKNWQAGFYIWQYQRIKNAQIYYLKKIIQYESKKELGQIMKQIKNKHEESLLKLINE